MKQIDYTCIVCPQSCDITLVDEEGKITVSGNRCVRGENYARNEYTNPRRMITTTVSIKGSHIHMLPVISSDTVPKEMLKDCLHYLYTLQLEAPVTMGQIVVQDILGTGIDIIAARTISRSDQ